MEKNKNNVKVVNLDEKILISKFAHQKAKERKIFLEKEVKETALNINKDMPDSNDNLLAVKELNRLVVNLGKFYEIEVDYSNQEKIQIGDTVVFKDKKIGKFSRVVDGYAYSTNVCPSLIHLIGKSRGEKVNFGIFSEVEILDFYPTNENQTISNQTKKVI